MKLASTILATLLAVAAATPERPPDLTMADDTRVPNADKCAFVYGDPHIHSWDHEEVDCRMGGGDFLYSKSRDSSFEIQVRHVEADSAMSAEKKAEKGWFIGTGAEAFVINTGVAGDPVLEVNAYTEGATSGGQCKMKYIFDGVEEDLPADATVHGVTFERRVGIDEDDIWSDKKRNYNYRNFYFEHSGVFIQVTKSYWSAYGCFMSVRFCIPDSIRSQDLYGMLGNANDDKEDDFMDKNGVLVTPKPQGGQRDKYCQENWCIAKDPTNMFKTPSWVDNCDTDEDAKKLYDAVQKATPLLKKACKDSSQCIFDTLATSNDRLGLSTLSDASSSQHNIKVIPPSFFDNQEEDYCTTPEGEKVDCYPYEYEFVCEHMVDYDFGMKLDSGCAAATNAAFHDLMVTDISPTCNVGGYHVGHYDMACGADGKEATITPKVDSVVKVSGDTTGMVYTTLQAGKTYTLTTGPGDKKEVISKMEFCFKCPTSIVNNDLVSCQADVISCPAGVDVGRDPENDCHFHTCPDPNPGMSNFMVNGGANGDPHLKTWNGHKYDYHGECDMVLVDNPHFAEGLGLKLHIRTTRVKHYSYIERAALKIGSDVLEFSNDVNTFTINGKVGSAQVTDFKIANRFRVHRFNGINKAISVRLDDSANAKIDFHQRKNGMMWVNVDTGSNPDLFPRSLGLIGQYESGEMMGRDNSTVFVGEDRINDFANEWQVKEDRDGPLLFQEARAPQYPQMCLPPRTKSLGSRLGSSHMKAKAEKVCASWKEEDRQDCIFDVIHTRDTESGQVPFDVEVEYAQQVDFRKASYKEITSFVRYLQRKAGPHHVHHEHAQAH